MCMLDSSLWSPNDGKPQVGRPPVLACCTLSRTGFGFLEGQPRSETGKRLIEGDAVQDKGGEQEKAGERPARWEEGGLRPQCRPAC